MEAVPMKSRLVLCVFTMMLALAVAFSGSAKAQSTTDGAIGGTVADSSGAMVPNASITVTNPSTNNQVNGATDGSGRYLITHLPPGVYSLQISASGFAVFKATGFTVEVGRATIVDTVL